jgi:hypothetical protein
MLLLILLLLLVFGGGFGYIGHRQWGEGQPFAGPGIGLGTVLLILLICYLLGVI